MEALYSELRVIKHVDKILNKSNKNRKYVRLEKRT